MDSLRLFPPAFLATQFEATLSDNVTLDTQPGQLIASGNKNCFILKSKILGDGQIYVGQLEVTGDIFEGDYITLTSEVMGELRLDAKDVPSLLEFQTTLTAGSADAVADDMARALNDSIIFNRFYIADAYQVGALVRITAKSKGTKFIAVQSHSGNITPVSTVLGLDKDRGQSLKNYGVYMDLFTGEEENFGGDIDKAAMTLIGTIEKKYQPDNCHEIDISGMLDNEFEESPLVISWPALQFKPLVPYVVLWGESYSVEETFRRKFLVGTSGVKWGIKAANKISTYNSYELINYIIQQFSAGIKPLTNQPACKQTTLEGQQFISHIFRIINPTPYIAVYSIIPTFMDGTTGTELLLTAKVINKGGIYQINTSPENLNLPGIEALAGKKIKSYEIGTRYISNAQFISNPLGPVLAAVPQKYELIQQCYDSPTQLAFLNQWGCWDSVEMLGEQIDNTKRSASEFLKSIPCELSQGDFIRGPKNIQIEKTEKHFTGWIEEDAFEWLTELGASPRVYKIIDGELIAVFLTSISLRKDKDKEKYFAEIELQESAPFNTLEI